MNKNYKEDGKVSYLITRIPREGSIPKGFVVYDYDEALSFVKENGGKIYRGEEVCVLHKLLEPDFMQEVIGEWHDAEDWYTWSDKMKDKWKKVTSTFIHEFKENKEQYITDYNELVYDSEVDV